MTRTLILAFNKDGKQVGLYEKWEDAEKNPDVTEGEFWDLNEKTGQYHPTRNKVCKLELVPTKEEYEKSQKEVN